MNWFSNFRNVKLILIVVAAIIAATSLFVSNSLVKDLKSEEEKKMQVWAAAMDYINRADENTDLSLVLEVSESRVSQLHTKALLKMRKKMGTYMDILMD